ncbi:hypothetical protein H5410_062124 [Solanum commersonii]|uniref:Uncharacterized protein n=1 Tax=Solanum commersonii TaxID=4109 RepID=A0A9J5WBP3_SOLCO|nr:hypothetical protein H5410_062124 [Solanum commersonii]
MVRRNKAWYLLSNFQRKWCYLERVSMLQILRFIRRCHMKWGDFIMSCRELRRIKDMFCELVLIGMSSTEVTGSRCGNNLVEMLGKAVYNRLLWSGPSPDSKHCRGLFLLSILTQFMSLVACLKGQQRVQQPWWTPSCISVVFKKTAKRNRQCRVVSLNLEP